MKELRNMYSITEILKHCSNVIEINAQITDGGQMNYFLHLLRTQIKHILTSNYHS